MRMEKVDKQEEEEKKIIQTMANDFLKIQY